MGFEMDYGTIVMVAMSIVGAFWGLVKLMFVQYEKRQDLRFETLGVARWTLTATGSLAVTSSTVSSNDPGVVSRHHRIQSAG